MSPEIAEIANTNFELLYRSDPREAEERIAMLICDPEFAAYWFLKLIQQEIFADVETDDARDNIVEYYPVIDILQIHGPLPALRQGLVTFEDLVRLIANPYALRFAHEAVVGVDIDALLAPASDPQPSPYVPSELHRVATAFALSASSSDDDQSDWDSPTSGVEAAKLPSLIHCFDDWAELNREAFIQQCANFGVIESYDFDLQASLSGAPVKQDVYLPSSQEVVAVENGRVSILAPLAMFPHGLCRLTLIEIGAEDNVRRTLSLLPPMHVEGDRWYWERSLYDLFGRNMTGSKIRIALEISSHSDFRCPEVESFVAGLPDGEQKTRAQAYLSSKRKEPS